MAPRVPVPAQRDPEHDPVLADDRLVERARHGRLCPDDPDPLVRFLARLAARGRGDGAPPGP